MAKKKFKLKKPPKPKHNTIGVRLCVKDLARVFTYRVRKGAKLHLGQELVLDTPLGPRIGYVVRIDKTPQDNEPGVVYKFADRRTVPL